MLDVMYERLNGDEQSRIMKKLAEAGRRARVQKQERLQAELARVRERVEREEEERRERRALQARIEERKLEKQRAEIAAEMRRKAGGVRPVREKTFGDKFAEAVATSDAVRKVAIAAQEIANSPLNPANLFMKAYNFSNGDGFKTGLEDVVKPETKTERAIGAGTRVLYDTLTVASLGGLAATSHKVTAAAASTNKFVRGAAKAFQHIAYPGSYMSQVGAAEGALVATSLADLKKPDENASFGQKAGYAAANLGIGLAGAIAGGGIAAGAGSMLGQRIIQRGKKELTRQLKTQDYKDIEMGWIQRKALMKLNDVRMREGVPPMQDNMLNLTKKQVEHIYEGRVKENKKGYGEVVDSIDRLMHSRDLRVAAGNKIQNQEIANVRSGNRSADVAYVSVFKKENRLGAFSKYLLGTGEKTGIVTTMKKDKKRLGK